MKFTAGMQKEAQKCIISDKSQAFKSQKLNFMQLWNKHGN